MSVLECEGKIGCHSCVNFMMVLEAKCAKVLEAVDQGATPNIVYEIQEVMKFIKAFRKGE